MFMASHNMSEVERLCDQVIMLRSGRIVDTGPPHELIRRYGRQGHWFSLIILQLIDC